MGPVVSIAIPAVWAITCLIDAFRSDPPEVNPTHQAIESANEAQEEQKERDRAAQAAKEEAERLAHEADMQAERARRAQQEAEDAMRAAREESERARKEAEEAQRKADAERAEAQRQENELREEARRRAAEAEEERRRVAQVQAEALRQQQLADEENRRARDAQQAAEAAAQKAKEEALRAQAAKEEAERQLREGIQPVVMPSAEDLKLAKQRIDYRDGLYHFAIAGIAGSGKSSLINAFRGLRNRDAGAAATGITETTLRIARFPDADSANPFVWYDIPGAGTLQVRDWQYFNEQGLYVFDAIIVLVDNRFTSTDVAILRNCRLFGIPSYIVRSKADTHVLNVMKEMGYDSEDEDDSSRAKLEHDARKQFVSATRQSVRSNLQAADLPDQYVYIVSNSTLFSIVKSSVSKKTEKKIIDEYKLLQDFLGDARKRRGARPVPPSTSSAHGL